MRTIYFLLLAVAIAPVFAADSASVATAIKEDGMTQTDARKWFTIYRGANLYMKEYGAVGSKNFGDVFDRLRQVRDKSMPTKGNTKFILATDLSKFAELEFTPENQSDLADEFYKISGGLRMSINDK